MKKLTKALILILILLVTGCSFTEEKLKVDYYSYINQAVIDSHDLGEDEFYWGNLNSYQDKVDDQVDEVLKEIIKNNIDPNINIIYNQMINTEEKNRNGLSSLSKYLNLIDNSNTIDEFINNATTIENTLGVSVFTMASISKDFKDTSKNILYLYPVPFDFSANADYYIKDDYLSSKALVKQYGIKLLKLYGYDKKKAREVSKKITDYYTEIAKKSKTQDYFTDFENMYNIITKEELKQIYSNLPSSYFDFIPDSAKISILDRGNYEAINASLTDTNLETLKESVKLKILETYCQYLSEDYAKVATDLKNEQLGIKDTKTKEELAKDVILNLFKYDIDNYYEKKYISKDSKKYVLDMIDDIINYYESNIKDLEWLSKETKEKAIHKLKNITVNIGLSPTYPKYSKNYNISSNNTLIDNIISIMKTISDYEYHRLETNEPPGQMEQIIVNAYYNPQDNSINFPSATMNIVDFNKNYYENLGTVGMIIAHEITHAFDSNGSKFDEKGNLVNWWSKTDEKNYKKLQDKVITYYDKYEVLPGNYLNGKITVDENIADLGAVACISGIAKSKKATKEQIQSMYKSFASIWAEKSTDQYAKLLLLVDTHSPGKYRVNATLASTPDFYEVYDISKDNPMYIPEKERLKIW